MYFITALVCTIIAGLCWFFNRQRKKLHLDVLAIVYGAATLMWFVDCVFSAIKGEGFLSFGQTIDGWISLWTIIGGIGFWLLISFILNNSEKMVVTE